MNAAQSVGEEGLDLLTGPTVYCDLSKSISTSSPVTSSSPSSSGISQGMKGDVSREALIGGAVGGVLGVFCLLPACCFSVGYVRYVRRRQQEKRVVGPGKEGLQFIDIEISSTPRVEVAYVSKREMAAAAPTVPPHRPITQSTSPHNRSALPMLITQSTGIVPPIPLPVLMTRSGPPLPTFLTDSSSIVRCPTG